MWVVKQVVGGNKNEMIWNKPGSWTEQSLFILSSYIHYIVKSVDIHPISIVYLEKEEEENHKWLMNTYTEPDLYKQKHIIKLS